MADINTFFRKMAAEYLEEMFDYSNEYAYIVGAKKHKNDKVQKKLDYIRLLRMSTMNTILFDVLVRNKNGELTDKEITEIIDTLLVYGVRRRICGEHENENKGFVKILAEMQSVVDAKDKKKAMFDVLATREQSLLLPNNKTLETNLGSISTDMAKKILIMTEETITKNSRFDIFDSELELEHIMSQSSTDGWKAYLGPDWKTIYDERLDSLGNLSLTYRNKELSNKMFDVKKTECYEKGSNLQISKNYVTDVSVWDTAAMDRREIWLVRTIVDDVLEVPSD